MFEYISRLSPGAQVTIIAGAWIFLISVFLCFTWWKVSLLIEARDKRFHDFFGEAEKKENEKKETFTGRSYDRN